MIGKTEVAVENSRIAWHLDHYGDAWTVSPLHTLSLPTYEVKMGTIATAHTVYNMYSHFVTGC